MNFFNSLTLSKGHKDYLGGCLGKGCDREGLSIERELLIEGGLQEDEFFFCNRLNFE